MDISFIIPIRIESEDRLRNCVSIVSYLLNIVPTGKVYIKEVDSESVFQERALPLIRRYADTENLNHTFEQSSKNSLFHRTKYINDLFEQTSTKVVWHYDVDVIFPKEESPSKEISFQFIFFCLSGLLDFRYPASV